MQCFSSSRFRPDLLALLGDFATLTRCHFETLHLLHPPTLAEDARVGLPALRLVHLGGWGPLTFSGCGWRAGKVGTKYAVQNSFVTKVVVMNAEGLSGI